MHDSIHINPTSLSSYLLIRNTCREAFCRGFTLLKRKITRKQISFQKLFILITSKSYFNKSINIIRTFPIYPMILGCLYFEWCGEIVIIPSTIAANVRIKILDSVSNFLKKKPFIRDYIIIQLMYPIKEDSDVKSFF